MPKPPAMLSVLAALLAATGTPPQAQTGPEARTERRAAAARRAGRSA